jgi:putative PIN family toxin of toxin-antitoxin system
LIFVVDTNIIIKYALGDENALEAVKYIIEAGEFAVNDKIINEYKLVLSREKLNISLQLQNEIIELILNNSKNYPYKFIRFNKDREDEKFLSAAKTSNADYLITEDKAIKNAQWKLDTKIVSLSDFLEEIDLA